MDCRRNNEFINQAVAVTIVKTTADHFIFTERGEEPDFTFNYSENEKVLLLSPMGGQGFLIGRGNLQLSPDVLRKIGIDNIMGVATPAKLLSSSRIRIDTRTRTRIRTRIRTGRSICSAFCIPTLNIMLEC